MGEDQSNEEGLPTPANEKESAENKPNPIESASKKLKELGKQQSESQTAKQPAVEETREVDPKRVQIQGRDIQLRQRRTVRQIKQQIGVSDDNLAYVRKGNNLQTVSDDEPLYDHVDEGDRVTFRAGAKKNPFG
ncbi:hypothetical protein HT576_08720 [Haloterrigena sp. SYSU A121-1]|uniref:Uncharacterized protein n=1 Tax=Haloterrigena gelatinilytica TaxID=2741724 RepID=A0A8J8GMP2_9EURY|nr:hypothetical protein [Haloterrigena gelatinilytica]NUB91102.1 hypothetical protein [Haloterrigena gelatinilytica]